MTLQRIILLNLLAGLLFTLSVQAQTALDINDPAVVEAFVDGAVKPTMERAHNPSGVVMVMKDGKIIFAKGYGYIDLQKRIPVDPDTSLFRPGSISKLFTWVAVMQQVEQGRLDLDTDVNRYLKSFQIEDSWPGQPVTLRHIMTHTAGFEDGGLGYLIVDDPERLMPLAESLAKYQPQRVNPPGMHTAYSNWATALAGLIVQNVAGQPFNDYVQRHIFAVLDMQHSSFAEPLPADLQPRMAKNYKYHPRGEQEISYELVSNFGPAGAMATTALDMSKFAGALLNDGEFNGRRILQADTLQRMLDDGFSHDPRVRGMGLGLLLRQYGADGLDIYGHDGATLIFFSHFGLSRQENLMLFTSFSGSPGGPEPHKALVKSFYDAFFPRAVAAIPPPADFAGRADKYIGTYHSWRNNYSQAESLRRMLGETKVAALDDNTLLIGDKRYLEVDHNLFRQLDGYQQIAFQQDADGSISGFVVDGMGVAQSYKAPLQDTLNFNLLLLALCLLIFCSVVLRLVYQWRLWRSQTGIEYRAWLASAGLALSNLLFVILLLTALTTELPELMFNLPTSFTLALCFPILAVPLLLAHAFYAVQIWRHRLLAGSWARIRYSLVTLAGFAMLWFCLHWNLLGFHYYS
ncbi:serine hydrolase domain-containing protein [Bowmanella denitrificans]|uniref:serine hydrolase domain-containing protein n=1 Tax=Bowmanella denitrificans TaxID=366582 RepID=UPI000C9B7E8C|nr:serine hydrolase domain-containing protein [Bowmanella denitrificans]